MSRSCDLFSEGPQKRYPHALGLDELIELIRGLISVFSLPFGFCVLWPIGPLSGLFATIVSYRASVYTSGFYRDYKNHRWIPGLSTY
jgi:hypothetical protein